MVTSSFVNQVVWCLIVLVGAAPLLLVIEVGGFGTTAQSYFRSLWHPLYAVYQAHKSSFDLLILVIGTTVPAVSGGLAILKGFYYAEMNLPKRLQELVDRVREQHLHERPKLLSYVSGPFDTRDFLVPTILSNPLAQMLRLFGWVSLRNQVRDFASAVDQFQDEIKVLATKKEDVENKKVTAHLLRGAYFAAKAKEFDQISLDYRGHIEKSLAEYEAVLAMRGADLDALEGAAVQAGAIGDVTKQRSYLDSAISVADLQKQLLRHARALRKSAVIIERGGTPNDWNLARGRLLAGWKLLDRKWANNAAEALELAEILLLYGDVQTTREKFYAARRSLERAGALFAAVEGDVGEMGTGRVKAVLARLNSVERRA